MFRGTQLTQFSPSRSMRVFRAARIAAAVLTLAVVVSPSAASTVVFDNIDPNPSPWAYLNWGRFTGTHAGSYQTTITSFEPSAGGALDEIWAGLLCNNVGHQNQVTLTLRADAGGTPGAPLWSTTRTDELDIYFGNLSHISNLAGPVLQANQRYWLEAAAPQDGFTILNWYSNNQGDVGPVTSSLGGVISSFDRPALRIGVIPEPASLLLIALGALLLRRRG